jgi:nucleoside-diphosphate-sugar epimerase
MVVADLGDSAALHKACEGVSAVIHAAGLAHVFGSAARDLARFRAVNEIGTANMMDAAVRCGVSNVVVVSSVSVYGSYAGRVCNEAVHCNPETCYAISKRQGELRAIERAAKEDISLTILRFATIYGAGDQGNVAKLIRALDRGRFIWPGPGNNQKSLICKEDAAHACLVALERPVSGTEIFNVSAKPESMRMIVSTICQVLGRPVPRLAIPLVLLRTAAAASERMGDPGQFGQRLRKFIHDDVYDGSRFESTFNFHPTITLFEGLRREVEFLKAPTAP